MNINYANAVTNINKSLTISGLNYPDKIFFDVEIHISIFISVFVEKEIISDADLRLAFENIEGLDLFLYSYRDHSPDWVDNRDVVDFALYGLIALDEIAKNWDENNKEEIFLLQEKIHGCSEVCRFYLNDLGIARENANKRHEKTKPAKLFVKKEWEINKNHYKNNKSDFSRTYVKLVLNNFCVIVTEKQMREVWLKDTPSASKHAGVAASR